MEDIKEKTADEMFEELGYEKKFEDEYEINYEYDKFELGDRFYFILLFAKKAKIIFHKDTECNVIGIEINLLQAINKKCKELRLVRR